MYLTCVGKCPNGDFECIGACSRDYDENHEFCPCQSGCPTGCPCPVYQCPSTTTPAATVETTSSMPIENKSVLILHKIASSDTCQSEQSVLTDGRGNEHYPMKDYFFMYGDDTEVHYSCSVTYRGKLFIYGGQSEKTQISTLNGCKVERIGSLAFQHYLGACGNVNDEAVYLCFDSNSRKTCRKSNEPTTNFVKVKDSLYDHYSTRIGASPSKLNFKSASTVISALLLAIGSSSGPSHKHAELFLTATDTWVGIADYPFGKGLTTSLIILLVKQHSIRRFSWY